MVRVGIMEGMAQQELDTEIQIILESAQEIDINDNDDVIRFVKIAIAASDRMLVHIANLADIAVAQKGNIEVLQNSVLSITQTSQQLADNVQHVTESTNRIALFIPSLSQKTTLSFRLGTAALLVIAAVLIVYFWRLIPPEYVGNTIFLVLGVSLVPIATWVYRNWKA